jgi:hypothetical protein
MTLKSGIPFQVSHKCGVEGIWAWSAKCDNLNIFFTKCIATRHVHTCTPIIQRMQKSLFTSPDTTQKQIHRYKMIPWTFYLINFHISCESHWIIKLTKAANKYISCVSPNKPLIFSSYLKMCIAIFGQALFKWGPCPVYNLQVC